MFPLLFSKTVSDISSADVKAYLRIDVESGVDLDIEQIFAPAAVAHIVGYTGLTEEEVLASKDLTLPFLVLICEMYENRELTQEHATSRRMNMLVSQILDKYSRNLL